MEEDINSPSQTPTLNVAASASFPQSEIFGVKLINGHPTKAHLSFTNNEAAPVTVAYVGASLVHPQANTIIRNLTSSKYNVEITPGNSETLTYTFVTELYPQDLRLNIAAAVVDQAQNVHTIQVHNATVSTVEPPQSLFDPQMYARPCLSGSTLPLFAKIY